MTFFETQNTIWLNALRLFSGKGKVYAVEGYRTFRQRDISRNAFNKAETHIMQLLKDNKVKLLSAQEISAQDIYFVACEKAVKIVEEVYPRYRQTQQPIIDYAVNTLKTEQAEDVFRINLCEQIAEFYSTNVLMERIAKTFSSHDLTVFPIMNVFKYKFIQSLLPKESYFIDDRIRFSKWASFKSLWQSMGEFVLCYGRLIAQVIISAILSLFQSKGKTQTKSYAFGISIMSMRQLMKNRRQPSFIIDEEDIKVSDVVYFPMIPLDKAGQQALEQCPGDTYAMPQPGAFFSHAREWGGLLSASIRKCNRNICAAINAASNLLFNYFATKEVLSNVHIDHYFTHCDFGMRQVGRSIALKEHDVQSWFFMDSMNQGDNYPLKGYKMLHPFWCYLNFDHFIAWDQNKVDFFSSHPGPEKQYHVVGCLWAEHVLSDEKYDQGIDGDKFSIAVFDTTYTKNSLTSYHEGITFAQHILQLANYNDQFVIHFKEKKPRSTHKMFDQELGPQLIKVYDEMQSHPRIHFYSDEMDSSSLVAQSQLVISFPYTSTTYEALSINHPAIWHDPIELYRDTPYGKMSGVMTHGFDELKQCVDAISRDPNGYQVPIKQESPFMDPFRDGKAINRLRDLLTQKESMELVNG